jgi:rRNA-processing protein FCF1
METLTLKVIFDSNFLFIPARFKIDIFEESAKLLNQKFEPVLLSSIYQELKKIAEKGVPSRRRQASLALKLADKCKLVNVEKGLKETNDDVILRIATLWKSPVATNDRELQQKLRVQGIPIIYLRSKKRLELTGFL